MIPSAAMTATLDACLSAWRQARHELQVCIGRMDTILVAHPDLPGIQMGLQSARCTLGEVGEGLRTLREENR